MHAARMAGQFDTMVGCFSPVRLENEAETALFQATFFASRKDFSADQAKQLDEFLKTHGLSGLADVKIPKDADLKVPKNAYVKTLVTGLLARIKDRSALVADHLKRMAAYRAERGGAPFPAPTLNEVKIAANRAEGQAVTGEGTNRAGRTVYFEFIDGSWRSTLKR